MKNTYVWLIIKYTKYVILVFLKGGKQKSKNTTNSQPDSKPNSQEDNYYPGIYEVPSHSFRDELPSIQVIWTSDLPNVSPIDLEAESTTPEMESNNADIQG